MNGFSLHRAKKQILSKTKQQKLLDFIDHLDIIPSDSPPVSLSDMRVCAVSMTAKPYNELFEFIADVHSYVAKARQEGAQLICFPAYTGLLMLSAFPVWPKLLKEFHTCQTLEDALALTLDNIEPLLRPVCDAYLTIFSELARLHGVSILAGSILYPEEELIHHRAYLFDRYGYPEAFQDKIFLSPLEQKLGIHPGSRTTVADTELGKIAILIGEDARYYEVADIAVRKGAELLLNCDAALGPFNPYSAQAGLEMRVQEAMVYGVKSVMLGEFPFGMRLHGRSGIYAPFCATSDLSGVLAQSDSYKHDALLTSSLDLTRLPFARDLYHADTNPSLSRKNAPACYLKVAEVSHVHPTFLDDIEDAPEESAPQEAAASN